MLYRRVFFTFAILVLLSGMWAGIAAPRAAAAQGGGGEPDNIINLFTPAAPASCAHLQYEIRATWCGSGCGTDWEPSAQVAWFECQPTRQFLGHGVGDDSAPYGDGVLRWPRLICADGKWAAGYWYHNRKYDGGFSLTSQWCEYDPQGNCAFLYRQWTETWTSATIDGSNFGPDDDICDTPPGGGGGGGGNETPLPPETPGETREPTERPPTRRPTDRPIVPLPEAWDEYGTTPPLLEMGYLPLNPVIIGQDPAQDGVTLCFTVTTYPVIHTHHWYTCEHPPSQPTMCYAGTIVEHISTANIPDPPQITNTLGLMKLTPESVAWIDGTLGPRFGVHVMHPEWAIPPYPEWPWVIEGPLAGNIYKAYGCNKLLVEDPGWYIVDLAVTTNWGVVGTFPKPKPQVPVTGFGVTLIK